jgi:GNAT superfamily N-acetyltransferase
MTGLILQRISFAEVYPIWRDHLWPGRKSEIKPVSPVGPDLKYAGEIARSAPHFWGLVGPNGLLVGIISGYRTSPETFRSRGLYIEEHYRCRGLSRRLLSAVCAEAKTHGCKQVWSFPRHSAWPAYSAFGFWRASDWFERGMEFGPNCLAYYDL